MRVALTALLILFFNAMLAFGGEPTSDPEPTEVERTEEEVAMRLEELQKRQQIEKDKLNAVQDLEADLADLKDAPKPDAAAVKKKEGELTAAKMAHQNAVKAVESAQKLYDQAKEKLRIIRQNEERKNGETPAKPDTPAARFGAALSKPARVDQAELEAALAQRKVVVLREQLDLLLKRRDELRAAQDAVNEKLRAPDLTAESRDQHLAEQQDLLAEVRAIGDQISLVQRELWQAEEDERYKAEQAQAEAAAYAEWKESLLKSAIIVAGVIAGLILIRLLLLARIDDPSARYYVKRGTALVITGTILIGAIVLIGVRMGDIFTLLGIAIAGLIIALQDPVASMVGWFYIRGSGAYSVGDWVQIGPNCGEVIDISLLKTTLEQVQPFQNDHPHGGGRLTGGILTIMNNQVFKQPMVNYTRGCPFMWCQLQFVVTYESDWEAVARRVLADVAQDAEIIATAKSARAKMREMGEDFSIKPSPTDPVVLTGISPHGVELTIWFMAHPRRRVELLNKVTVIILHTLAQMGNAALAYQTVRSVTAPAPEMIHSRRQESSVAGRLVGAQ